MTAELPGVPGDPAGTQEPAPQADSGQGSPVTEGTVAPPQPSVDWEKRYKDLESYHGKQVQELFQKVAEYETVLGDYGLPGTEAPGAGAPQPQQPTRTPAYGYPPQQATPYTPPPEAPVDYGYYPQPPAPPVPDVIQARLDSIEAGMEVVAFANQNRWMSEDQMRQVVALRDGLENRYQQTVPLELALDRWLVESSKRVQAQNAAEEARKQAFESAEQARQEAVRQQTAVSVGQAPVMPGPGGQVPESEPPAASWEEVERKHLAYVTEIARQEGIIE